MTEVEATGWALLGAGGYLVWLVTFGTARYRYMAKYYKEKNNPSKPSRRA